MLVVGWWRQIYSAPGNPKKSQKSMKIKNKTLHNIIYSCTGLAAERRRLFHCYRAPPFILLEYLCFVVTPTPSEEYFPATCLRNAAVIGQKI
jgi:hypothetical protein